jgi:FlaG/FlaF family flagellin (archaellin)|tara:strand:+ start:531 stop:863 length:333 start_codon:yes stop_codon:yes gene_type:complete
MASLETKIKLYIEENSETWDDTKVSLQNDSNGKGDYISSWSYSFAKPTNSKLNELESDANNYETNKNIDSKRKFQYGSWEQQMEMIYKDQKNGTTTFKDHCDKVREDNPK